jgi:F-type H+-transporting ATPase subunit delta
MTDRHDPIHLAYARALLELAEDRDALRETADEADALQQVLDENPTLRDVFANPGINAEERAELIDKMFGDNRASSLMLNFLHILNRKNRLAATGKIMAAFEHLLDEKLGKIEVNVTVAEKLDDGDLEEVRTRVGRALGKDAIIHQYVDPNILGGMVLRVEDQIIDASVKTQLDAMRERLMRA